MDNNNLNMNNNQFIEWDAPYEVGDIFYGFEPPGTVVTITNSYPVYRKIQDDMKNGIYLDESFIQHKNLENLSLAKFTISIDAGLIEFIKWLYLEGKKRNLIEKYFNYIEVLNYYNNFKFIFAKRGGSLVFLNYIPLNQKMIVEDFIPYMKETKHNHYITLNNKKIYRITNTYDVFNNYANINGLLKNYGVNSYLYPNFENTIKNENFREFEFIIQNECMLNESYRKSSTSNHFEYFVLNNTIIINQYDMGSWNYRDWQPN